MNNYTLSILLFQKARLEEMINGAKYDDQVIFWTKTLAEVNKDIENIDKNDTNSSDFYSKSYISE